MEDKECHPLKTPEEIYNWTAPVTLINRRKTLSVLPEGIQPMQKEYRTLVCHDMMGGYLDDRFIGGTSNPSNYRFWHWDMVDVFVYFSHHLLTIPPPGWIHAGHTHHVQVLGTFITEWEEGGKICEDIFTDNTKIDILVDKMVQIASYHGFDGYLINIENKLSEAAVKGMPYFLERLKKLLKEVDRENLVIWYDSVTTSGNLDWQNELNANNYPFFNASDGIFLNYAWNEKTLQTSTNAAGNRSFDVFVGVDVFGRGCFGGGEWNTWKAVNEIQKLPLSVALFAPGWVFEKFEDDFQEMQTKFWNLLKPCLPRESRKTGLPIVSSFCQGSGQRRYQVGKIIGPGFFNLSWQHLQPPSDESGYSYFTDDAYIGGGCLKVLPRTFTRLLEFKATAKTSCLVCVAFKTIDEGTNQVSEDQGKFSALSDLVLTEDGELRFFIGNSANFESSAIVQSIPREDWKKYRLHVSSGTLPDDDCSWEFRMFTVRITDPVKLKTVTVETAFSALIGYVSVAEMEECQD